MQFYGIASRLSKEPLRLALQETEKDGFFSESEKESEISNAVHRQQQQQFSNYGRLRSTVFFCSRSWSRPNRLAAQLCGERGSNTNDGPSGWQLASGWNESPELRTLKILKLHTEHILLLIFCPTPKDNFNLTLFLTIFALVRRCAFWTCQIISHQLCRR